LTSFDLTITHQGHDLHVVGDISPAEKATWSEWNGGYPGCPACLEDLTIFLVRGKKERKLEDPDGKLGEKIEDTIFDEISRRYDD
jgi:hypothetical protein